MNSSALRLSLPGAFLFFRVLIARIISSFVGGSRLMSRSVSGSDISGISSGIGLFRSSLKCSVHLLSISFFVVLVF